MPNSVVKSFAEKTDKSVEEVERLWNEMKESVKEDGGKESDSDFYAKVTGRLKNALGIKEETFLRFSSFFSEGEEEEAGDKAKAEKNLKKKLRGVDDNKDSSKGKKKNPKKPTNADKEKDDEMDEAIVVEADEKDKKGEDLDGDGDNEGTPQEHLVMVIDWIEEDSNGDESGEEGDLDFGLMILRDIAEYLSDEVADAAADALVEYYGMEHYADDNEDDDKEATEEELKELDDYVNRIQRDDDSLDEKLDAKKKRKLFLKKKRKGQLGSRANTAAFKRNYYFDKEKGKFVKRNKPQSMSTLRKKKRILKKIAKRKSTQIRMKRTKKRLAHVKNPYQSSLKKNK